MDRRVKIFIVKIDGNPIEDSAVNQFANSDVKIEEWVISPPVDGRVAIVVIYRPIPMITSVLPFYP